MRKQIIAELQKMGIVVQDGKIKKSDIEAALNSVHSSENPVIAATAWGATRTLDAAEKEFEKGELSFVSGDYKKAEAQLQKAVDNYQYGFIELEDTLKSIKERFKIAKNLLKKAESENLK